MLVREIDIGVIVFQLEQIYLMKMQKEKLYEVICFNKALNDDDINTITDKLKIYYPFT